MKTNRVVITYGTYDLLHPGHINIFKRAKSLGDILIVGVSTDEFNELKGKKSIQCFDDRKQIVKAIKYVDKVIPETSWDQKLLDIKKYNVETFVMGDDWLGKFDYLENYGVKVIYLPRTKGISTTIIKNKLKS